MRRRLRRFLGCVAILWWIAAAPAALAGDIVPDAEIRRILVERVDEAKQAVGIVVGVIEPAGRRLVAYGRRERNGDRAPDGDTLFEIGSVTKVFTAMLLAEMAGRGEVGLDEPVEKLLPPKVKVPVRGRAITLEDLSNHRSGLPRLPTNVAPLYRDNPFAAYTVEALYRFLADHRLRRDVGEKYEYSNLAVGLLGHALAFRAGRDYETLLRERILMPLGMDDTRIALSPERAARLAPGHNRMLTRVPNWDLPTLAGAGALRSSANDLLTFLAACLGYVESPLAPVVAATLARRWPSDRSGMQSALGWHVLSRGGIETVWHSGLTGGYRSFVAMVRKQRIGVIVLSNAVLDINDIGFHLLDPRRPLTKPGSAASGSPISDR